MINVSACWYSSAITRQKFTSLFNDMADDMTPTTCFLFKFTKRSIDLVISDDVPPIMATVFANSTGYFFLKTSSFEYAISFT